MGGGARAGGLVLLGSVRWKGTSFVVKGGKNFTGFGGGFGGGGGGGGVLLSSFNKDMF